MDVRWLIEKHQAALTPAERRVAEAVLHRPQSVAFGTVADLARLTGTSGATVMRFAAKLGFGGFLDLQDRVQKEVAARLRPAAERIRQPGPDDVVAQVLAQELDNVQSTLHGIERRAFSTAVRWLADRKRSVLLCPADCARGVVDLVADQLISIRPGVSVIEGNQVRVGRQLALIQRDDVMVVVDFRRYDRWTLRSAQLARERGARMIALTDSPLSPLASLADTSFLVSAAGAGPFDSQVGTLALLNALVAGTAAVERDAAVRRVGEVERVWQAMDALAAD